MCSSASSRSSGSSTPWTGYAPTATVVRDGRARTIPAQELVLDDIVLLSAGDQVCAAAPALMAVSTFLVSRVKAWLRCSGPLPRQAEAFS